MTYNWVEKKWGFKEDPFSINPLETDEELEKLFVNREDEVKEL